MKAVFKLIFAVFVKNLMKFQPNLGVKLFAWKASTNWKKGVRSVLNFVLLAKVLICVLCVVEMLLCWTEDANVRKIISKNKEYAY